jgi:hypothetical protein
MGSDTVVVAGWLRDDKTGLNVFTTVDAARAAYPEVFHGAESVAQMRESAAFANAEGNYHEFVFRPAWPDEVETGTAVVADPVEPVCPEEGDDDIDDQTPRYTREPIALEMVMVCERCGGVKAVGQSCGCFDNGGQ